VGWNQDGPYKWTVVAPISQNAIFIGRGYAKIFLNIVEVQDPVFVLRQYEDLLDTRILVALTGKLEWLNRIVSIQV